MYHFLFVPLTLGLSWILVTMESAYVMTGREIYKDMTRFWGKLFGINFALGVTTGITMEFQFGTYWAFYSIMAKTVEVLPSAWLSNYSAKPWTILAPLLAYIGIALTLLLSRLGKAGLAFTSSSIGLAGIILTAGFSMFPFIMPSSSHFSSSLTIWDATSSQLTLTLMFWAVVIFLPVVLAYTVWVYRVMRGPVTEQTIDDNQHSMY